jgi:hypothetical protein
MAEQTEWELDAARHFLEAYKMQWDLNQDTRLSYDEDMEYYLGHISQNKYPLVYNMSFNKLLPRIMTILSRFMDQMYQPASHNFVAVRPRKRADVDRAPRISALLNFQMETLNDCDAVGGAYMFHLQWMLNAMSWGKGIAKCYWKKEERISPRRILIPYPVVQNGQIVDISYQDLLVEEPQVTYDGPYCEVRPNKTFVPHPHFKNIQDMPFVFDVYRRSVNYLKELEEKGVYRNVDKVGFSGTMRPGGGVGSGNDSFEAIAKSLSLEGYLTEAELNSERVAPEVDVIEGYGRYIFPEDDSPYEIDAGYKIKGKESKAIVHIGNYKTILKLEKNKYGYTPYFAIGCYMHPELFWDIGLIRLGKSIQEQVNVLGNTRFQNAVMMVNQMLKVRQDADIDPQALIWKPFGIVPVEDMGDIQPLVTGDVSQTGIFREQEDFFENAISDMLGLYPYNLGQVPPRQEHVGTIYSLQSMGEARTRLLMMTMDHQGFQPLLKYMMLLNTWHLPAGFEARLSDVSPDQQFVPLFPGDIHWDYDFTVRYTALEPALGKQFRIQQLLQWSQVWAQTPYLQHFELAKAMLELMDFHEADKFLKTPEQLAYEMQMQQQAQLNQQINMMQLNALLQDKMADRQAERGLIADVTKTLVKG